MNKKKEVTTHALLNNWSLGTFLREGIIRKLEASGARTKKRKTMNGGQTHLSTTADGLEVASNNKSVNKQWIKFPKSYTSSDLPTEAKEVATKEKLRKWKYLDNKSKKTCQDDNIKIGILNRANCSKTIEPTEVIPSQEGRPYAFHTVLDWCIVGSSGEKIGQPSLHCNIIKCLHQSNGKAFSCCRNSS